MLNAKTVRRWVLPVLWQDRIALSLVLGYQAIALIVFTVTPILAVDWVRHFGQQQQPDVSLPAQFLTVGPLAFFCIPYLLGLLYLGTGLWVFASRNQMASARTFAIFTTSTAVFLASLFDLHTTGRLSPLWTIAIALAGGALLNLALVFPEETTLLKRHRALGWIGYLPALILVGFSFSTPPPTAVQAPIWRHEYTFFGAAALVFIGWTTLRRYQSNSAITREQARILLWGSILSFGPMVVWMSIYNLRPTQALSPYLLLPFGSFPLFTGYALLRYRTWNTPLVLSRGIVYGGLTLLVGASFALTVSGLSLIFGNSLIESSPFLFGVMVALMAFLLTPVRDQFQKLVDSTFFRGSAIFRERTQDFGHKLTQVVELPDIIHLLRYAIEESLQPTQLHVFVHDPHTDQYCTAPDRSGYSTSDIRFTSRSALVGHLTRRRTVTTLDDNGSIPRLLQSDKARIALLNTQYFVALPGRERLTGWITLGPRRTGDPYTTQELSFLESLSDQAALAIERARVIVHLERRVHEMNVLSRVAQGVNITLNFDDMLELIYAQSSQVLPVDDFHITLHDKTTAINQHVFSIEDNERIRGQEYQPVPEHRGLITEVIQNKHRLVTNDYRRTCRDKGVLPSSPGILAWLGVPLNSGDDTIGTLSLGSRKPAVNYTPEHVELLVAIADQAAGGIAKSQLLKETERRARQMATLNEIAQSLSSTLSLDPLLDLILQSAVEIIDAQAGTLFLIDEGTGELIFKATAGPVANDLLGRRLPPKTGLAGKTAETRQPLIINNVLEDSDWADKPDQQTGFTTRALMVVPMQIKDRTIGVIEMINKRNGLSFNQEDLDLLVVYTGQAAVAIENARLYTLTDQALADRVDELSVMQRIDRELNASLQMDNTLRITLDWAIRQSSSETGLIGLVTGEGVAVLATHALNPDSEFLKNPLSLAEIHPIQDAIQGRAPVQYELEPDENQAGIPFAARSQLAIPIQRESKVIGVMLLGSLAPGGYPLPMQDFLTRLSDHAAIAISNAQLYSEVQGANLAKSDFVSFVSHELKTPMTSIKGFTDLLANGAVGEINPAQANFLETIRSNVDRMAELVSDLTDISRIEAGRLRLEFSAVDIPDIFAEVERSTLRQIEEKDQQLSIQIPADLPAIWGDRTRLIQILTNLVSNAYKYTPEKGEIRVYAEHAVDPNAGEEALEMIRIAVEDNGLGINPDEQRKIFQKFFRSEDPKAREVTGTGLGLSISKSLVEMQGGEIGFTSQYEQGTSFYFTIPAVKPD